MYFNSDPFSITPGDPAGFTESNKRQRLLNVGRLLVYFPLENCDRTESLGPCQARSRQYIIHDSILLRPNTLLHRSIRYNSFFPLHRFGPPNKYNILWLLYHLIFTWRLWCQPPVLLCEHEASLSETYQHKNAVLDSRKRCAGGDDTGFLSLPHRILHVKIIARLSSRLWLTLDAQWVWFDCICPALKTSRMSIGKSVLLPISRWWIFYFWTSDCSKKRFWGSSHFSQCGFLSWHWRSIAIFSCYYS